MAAKMIAFDQEARQAMQRGVAEAGPRRQGDARPHAAATSSSRSRSARPTVTKDGVTVAKEIELEDKYENMGAKMVKEVASKTSDVAGDGTTTATVMAEAIYNEGLKAVVAGVNPMLMKRGMDKAVEDIVEQLKTMSTKISDKKETEQVATVASNFDTEIGKMIAEATEKVGKDGVITVEEGKALKTEVEWVEGMQFDRGYLSPLLRHQPDHDGGRPRGRLHPDLREEDLARSRTSSRCWRRSPRRGKPLLIIAEDIEGEALATLVINKLRGTFRCAAVKAPGYGDRRKAMLEDIAVLTGGKPIFEDLGIELENVELDRPRPGQEGQDRQGQHDDHRGRRQDRRDQGPDRRDPPRDRRHQERLRPREARGAAGEARRRRRQDQRRRRDRERDEGEEGPRRGRPARHPRRRSKKASSPAAASPCSAPRRTVKPDGPDRTTRRPATTSSSAPARPRSTRSPRTPARTAAWSSPRSPRARATSATTPSTDEYTDLVKAGIIDPTKVTRSALQNAASVSTLLLTSDALIADMPKDEKPAGGGGHGGYDDMY